MEKGGMVKLDCMRLPSPMVPAMPHTIPKTDDGFPGVAFHWMEVEGPLIEKWPPPSYRASVWRSAFREEVPSISWLSLKTRLKDAEN